MDPKKEEDPFGSIRSQLVPTMQHHWPMDEALKRRVEGNLPSEGNEQEQNGGLSDLDCKILRQLEYYFGDINLPKDKFMKELMSQQEGWIDIESMLTFPRLAALSKQPEKILISIVKSKTELIEVDCNYVSPKSGIMGRIRRNPLRPLPELTDERRLLLQKRTVYVGGFPKEGPTLDILIEFFEKRFDQVEAIKLCTSRKDEDEKPRQFLGSVLVTFATEEAASKFFSENKSNLKYDSKQLVVRWQREPFNRRVEYSDRFDSDNLDKTVFVTGFDRVDTTQEEVFEFFSKFDGIFSAQRRMCRDSTDAEWKFVGSVFVRFEDRSSAQKFIDLPKVTYKGDKLYRKWQLDFFQEKRKFRREIVEWTKNKN